MNSTRTGKIACLPLAIRHEIHRRLDDGEYGQALLDWINGLPEVQAVLAARFRGRPIRSQNLSQWRLGGYRDYQIEKQSLAVAKELARAALAGELVTAECKHVTDSLAIVLAAHYAVEARRVDTLRGRKRWQLLRNMNRDIATLRRGDHNAIRLELERDRLKLGLRTPPRPFRYRRNPSRAGGGTLAVPAGGATSREILAQRDGAPADSAPGSLPRAADANGAMRENPPEVLPVFALASSASLARDRCEPRILSCGRAQTKPPEFGGPGRHHPPCPRVPCRGASFQSNSHLYPLNPTQEMSPLPPGSTGRGMGPQPNWPTARK
jgi:hypothetical protein